ncbi:MAG: hypothetical protein P4L90_07895 [Rhodopila sp.]|nr:hypothetical protein [Rhodopila sp.]
MSTPAATGYTMPDVRTESITLPARPEPLRLKPSETADGVVYVSDTLPFYNDNNVVHVGDAAAQTRHVLDIIKSVIETAGGTME